MECAYKDELIKTKKHV